MVMAQLFKKLILLLKLFLWSTCEQHKYMTFSARRSIVRTNFFRETWSNPKFLKWKNIQKWKVNPISLSRFFKSKQIKHIKQTGRLEYRISVLNKWYEILTCIQSDVEDWYQERKPFHRSIVQNRSKKQVHSKSRYHEVWCSILENNQYVKNISCKKNILKKNSKLEES